VGSKKEMQQELLNNAAPFATNNMNNGDTNIQMQEQPTLLQQSSHPTVLLFHLIFKILALSFYLFSYWIYQNYIFAFILVILSLAADFWTVKNVSGRLLVGLRWWNEIKEDGSSLWVFESKNTQANPVDARVFWWALYVNTGIWIGMCIMAIFGFKFIWLVLPVIAVMMNIANVVGYTKCDKDAKKKFNNFVAAQSQGWVGNMMTSQIGNMFSGDQSGQKLPV
jgi:hypothetical protein